MGPVLRAAARGLRAEAVFPGVRGPVVKLSSEHVGAGGDVTVHAEADGRMRYLVVALGPDEYRAAVAAHGEGTSWRWWGTCRATGGAGG